MPRTNVKKRDASKREKDLENNPKGSINVNSELRKLKRVIYFTDITPRYIAGDPEHFFLKKYDSYLTFIKDILANPENVEKFLDVLKKANNDPKLPRRVTLIYILAYALRNHPSDNKLTNRIADTVLEICRTDEEFFKFVSIFSLMGLHLKSVKNLNSYNKITTSVSRLIKKFLEKKTPSEYVKAVASSKGYHGWKYKDLIKLAHYKSETAEKLMITNYVLVGMKSLKETDNEELRNLQKILEDWYALKKPSEDIEKICQLIRQLKATYRNVNPKLIKHQAVWAAMIPNMEIVDVMQLLPKFLKYKMFEPLETSILFEKVKEAISVDGSCRVNPLEIFIHWKNFRKGGKPIDPKLEYYLKTNKLPIKVPSPVPEDNCISQILYKSFQNSQSPDAFDSGSNRNVMLVLDVAQFDSACFKQRNITCLEAEVALADYFSKTEKNLDIAVFNGDTLEPFELEKGADSFNLNVNKLKDVRPSRMNMHSMFDRALETKKNVDVFIYLLQTAKSLPSNPKEFRKVFKEALQDYQAKVSDLDVKIVVICLGSHSLAPFPECMKALTICGFCPEIPNVIRSFLDFDFHELKNGKNTD